MSWVLLSGLAATTVNAGRVDGIRVGLTPGNTRLVFDLDSPAEFEVQRPAEANFLVLDFPGIGVAPESFPGPWPGDLVQGVHSQFLESGGLRIQVALDRCVTLTVFDLGADAYGPDRLVVDLGDLPPAPDKRIAAQRVGPGCEIVPLPSASTVAKVSSDGAGAASAVPAAAVPSAATRAGTSMPPARRPTIQFGGTWEHEWAIAQQGGNQKFVSLFQPRFDVELAREWTLTAIARLRFDAVGELGPTAQRPGNYAEFNGPWYNTEYIAFELRELYLDRQFGNAFLRLGKQQVVWGEADGFKVLDVVNPQSFREFILDDFDESRIPLWMVNLEWALGAEDTLQVLWIPDTTYHELAEPGTPFAFSSPLLVPAVAAAPGTVIRKPGRPGSPLRDADIGARYRTLLGGWDISVNYLYSYGDFPVLRAGHPGLEVGEDTIIAPQYRRNHLIGGTLGTTFGSLALRAEGAWNSASWFPSSDPASGGAEESGEVASVIGLDWQRGSASLVSAQWFYSYATDHRVAMARGRVEQMMSLLLQQQFFNDSWQLRLLSLHSLDAHDSMFQLQLKHWLTTRLEVWVGVDVFSGDRRGLFGQFDDQDRVLAGLRLGF